MVITGTLLASLSPAIFRLKIFSASVGSLVLFEAFKGWVITKIRLEVLFMLLFWLTLWQALSLQVWTVALCYVFFGINWSTRQYVTHAWTPRDVIEGALNLKTSKVMEAILMNGNWDHVHHKYPHLPWSELVNRKYHEVAPTSYLKQYLSLWKGPRLNTEPAPTPISLN
jgi:fatty acid desaturase